MSRHTLTARLAPFAVLAFLAAGSVHATTADATPPAAAPSQPPSGAIQPDDDELAAIKKARDRCGKAGGPAEQQACMTQAQQDYYRARDAGGASKDGTAPPSAPPAAREPQTR